MVLVVLITNKDASTKEDSFSLLKVSMVVFLEVTLRLTSVVSISISTIHKLSYFRSVKRPFIDLLKMVGIVFMTEVLNTMIQSSFLTMIW